MTVETKDLWLAEKMAAGMDPKRVEEKVALRVVM